MFESIAYYEISTKKLYNSNVGSKEKIGKTFKKARKSLGLKQAEVAQKVGISSTYYSMIERDERENVGSKIMARIGKVLKLKSSDVFNF